MTVQEGPLGGNDGAKEWSVDLGDSSLTDIKIWSDSESVYATQFTYVDKQGSSQVSSKIGGTGGNPVTASIDADGGEKLTEISGTFRLVSRVGRIVLTSLAFKTNFNNKHAFGPGSGTSFSIQIPKKGDEVNVVGFFGKHGDRLDNLGFTLNMDA